MLVSAATTPVAVAVVKVKASPLLALILLSWLKEDSALSATSNSARVSAPPSDPVAVASS